MEQEDKIIKGAQELFFKYGLRSVTMDDIAKHLGMSKKTIYQCYADKDEMVHELMDRHIKHNECILKGFCEKSENVVEEVFNVMKNMTEIFSKINPLLFYELQKYHPKSWQLIKEFKERFVQRMVESSIEKGKKDGYVRENINTKIMARLRMEEVEMAFNPQLFSPDKFNILQVQLALAEHFLYGICTLKGHKLINKHKQVQEEE